MFNTITYNVEESIATISLNRPDALNAFNEQMMHELIQAYKEADQSDAVRVVILTAQGRAFCAGMDLSSGDDVFASEESLEEFRDTGGRVSLEVYKVKKPVIAAVNGAAVGIGATMLLPTDIRIFSETSKVGFVFGKRGIGPEATSGYFLPRLVGMSKALEWVYTGRMIYPEELLSSGLANYVVEDAYEKAHSLAKEIIENTSPVSNSFTRQLFYKMWEADHPEDSHLIESKFLYWASREKDVKEGIASFKEKRHPNFPLTTSDLPDFFKES
ncbi:enoyl-CoA hydratase-related protein [Chryseomicrobium aureum]|uniref:Enoyl-CoA hydratase n=1 Tax=Tetzosporium hominis TaxID=2020506 RepID=A0A264W3H8_9BACL|nr:enoyl-CoA hydratase-related protein [Tetzosporium hominis]OZS78130.1 enoyl-CoA hydratase [Tetzosporium hominis]